VIGKKAAFHRERTRKHTEETIINNTKERSNNTKERSDLQICRKQLVGTYSVHATVQCVDTNMDTTVALARRTRLVATHSPCVDHIFRRTKSHRDHMLLTQHLDGKSPPACKQQLKRSADHTLLLNISAHTVTAESTVCLHVSSSEVLACNGRHGSRRETISLWH